MRRTRLYVWETSDWLKDMMSQRVNDWMREQKMYWEYKRVSLLTELLRWVDILHFVSINVDQDDLGGAVRQTGVQTGHCDPNNNTVIFIFCSEDLKKKWVWNPWAPPTHAGDKIQPREAANVWFVFVWWYLGWLRPLPLCSRFLLLAPSVQWPPRFPPRQSTLSNADTIF